MTRMEKIENLDTLKLALVKESNDFSRSTLTALISWFTVFVSVNYVAIGWVAAAVVRKEMKLPVIALSTVFISQNGLGIYACRITRSWFTRAYAEVVQDKSPSRTETCKRQRGARLVMSSAGVTGR